MRFIFINASLCIKYVIAEIHPGKNKKIAADKKYKIFRYGWSYFQQSNSGSTHIGIICNLIAASHNLVFGYEISFVVIRLQLNRQAY